MAESTVAGVITAIAATFTAVALVITAVSVLIPTLRKAQINNDLVATNNKLTNQAIVQVKEVHHIVNQQRTDMQRYTRALVTALERAGVEVPDDQSIEPGPSHSESHAVVERIETAAASVENVAENLVTAIEVHNEDEESHLHPHTEGDVSPLAQKTVKHD